MSMDCKECKGHCAKFSGTRRLYIGRCTKRWWDIQGCLEIKSAVLWKQLNSWKWTFIALSEASTAQEIKKRFHEIADCLYHCGWACKEDDSWSEVNYENTFCSETQELPCMKPLNGNFFWYRSFFHVSQPQCSRKTEEKGRKLCSCENGLQRQMVKENKAVQKEEDQNTLSKMWTL